jgi:hypothetical protein
MRDMTEKVTSGKVRGGAPTSRQTNDPGAIKDKNTERVIRMEDLRFP